MTGSSCFPTRVLPGLSLSAEGIRALVRCSGPESQPTLGRPAVSEHAASISLAAAVLRPCEQPASEGAAP